MLGVAQPVGIREANGFGNEWKPGGLPEPNPTEPAGETGFAAHPISGSSEPNPDRVRRRDAPYGRPFLCWFAPHLVFRLSAAADFGPFRRQGVRRVCCDWFTTLTIFASQQIPQSFQHIRKRGRKQEFTGVFAEFRPIFHKRQAYTRRADP